MLQGNSLIASDKTGARSLDPSANLSCSVHYRTAPVNLCTCPSCFASPIRQGVTPGDDTMLGSSERLRGRHQPVQFHILQISELAPGLALSNSTFMWLHSRAVSKARSALVTAIFHKTTELNFTYLDANILTLMGTDVERITQGGLYPIHDIWANTIEVILASWFLHRHLGAAFIAPILVVSASVVSTSLIAKLAGPAMSKWTQRTEPESS